MVISRLRPPRNSDVFTVSPDPRQDRPPRGADQPASLTVRLTSLLYESMILFAILLVATGLFLGVAGDSRQAPMRYVLQGYLLVVAGIYFVWCWSSGRQTLPMRTWRLHVVDDFGEHLTPARAALRYLAAAVGAAAFGATFLWGFVDPQRKFLHDRITRTCLVRRPKDPSPDRSAQGRS